VELIVEKPSPLAATELVACEVVRGADFGCVWHHHPECEITLVLRGGTEQFVGDKLATLSAGDLVFLGPDLPHDYRNQIATGRRRAKVEAPRPRISSVNSSATRNARRWTTAQR